MTLRFVRATATQPSWFTLPRRGAFRTQERLSIKRYLKQEDDSPARIAFFQEVNICHAGVSGWMGREEVSSDVGQNRRVH